MYFMIMDQNIFFILMVTGVDYYVALPKQLTCNTKMDYFCCYRKYTSYMQLFTVHMQS